MQLFYLSCLFQNWRRKLHPLTFISTWKSWVLPCLQTPGPEHGFSMCWWVSCRHWAELGALTVWEWLCEQDIGQNGLALFAVPEHIRACWLCQYIHWSWKLSHSQCSCLRHERKWNSKWCKLLPPSHCRRGPRLDWDFSSYLGQSLDVDKDTPCWSSDPDKRTGTCSSFTMAKSTGRR